MTFIQKVSSKEVVNVSGYHLNRKVSKTFSDY
jgi:hypothetical protein